VFSVTPRPLVTSGKDPVPVVQETGWAPGPAWRGEENIALSGIRFPDRPDRSSVAIPTELPGPLKTCSLNANLTAMLPTSRPEHYCCTFERFLFESQPETERHSGLRWRHRSGICTKHVIIIII
jgi:hypothetical protein